MELLQKREKKGKKNGQMLIREEAARLIAFDHFFEFGIAESPGPAMQHDCSGLALYRP
jgi:hypothetical protein